MVVVLMEDADEIIDSGLFKPAPGRSESDFPGRWRDYCELRGLDPAVALLDNEVEYSPEMERAIKARMAIRKMLEK